MSRMNDSMSTIEHNYSHNVSFEAFGDSSSDGTIYT